MVQQNTTTNYGIVLVLNLKIKGRMRIFIFEFKDFDLRIFNKILQKSINFTFLIYVKKEIHHL